jgi:hypothetical protein
VPGVGDALQLVLASVLEAGLPTARRPLRRVAMPPLSQAYPDDASLDGT